MDHAQMGASKQQKAAPVDHSKMEHSQPAAKPAHMDHSKMDHGSMQGMDHGAWITR
jgi:copper resistance protein B